VYIQAVGADEEEEEEQEEELELEPELMLVLVLVLSLGALAHLAQGQCREGLANLEVSNLEERESNRWWVRRAELLDWH